jgi:alpha-L-arabinofuranosidase
LWKLSAARGQSMGTYMAKPFTRILCSISLCTVGAFLLCTCTNPEPSKEPAIASQLAEVEIDASRKVRTIPKELFGTNIEWAMNMQGIWKKEGPDPEVMRLAKDLRVSLIRYPAGSGADYYDWQQGVKPVIERTPQRHVISPDSEINFFGTDELVSFCRSINAEPLITVNLITDTADSASRWVSYCNDPADPDRLVKSKAPYAVRLWELGNESYMKPDNPNTKASSLKADVYCDRCEKYITAMKKADPSIKIAAIGGNNFTRFDFLADKDWNKAVLSRLGDKVDYLSVHNGYAPLIIESENYSVEEVYASLLAFPKLMEINLKALSEEIDMYASNNSQRIKIAVTEWAPLFHIATTSPWVDHPKTLGSGLYTALCLQTFLRSPRVDIATFFKLKDYLYCGTIGYDNIPKSSYYAIKMYSDLSNRDLVESRTESPKYDARALGLIPEIKNVPFLDTIAVMTNDKDKLSVLVVNKSNSSPIKAKISLRHFQPSKDCRVTVFSGSGLDCNNGKDIPDVPGYTWEKQKECSSNPQFYNGKPGTLSPKSFQFHNASSSFDFEFGPHSVTRIDLDAAQTTSVKTNH